MNNDIINKNIWLNILILYIFSHRQIVWFCHPRIQHPHLHIVMVPLSSQSCLKHVYKAINKLSTVSYCVTIPCIMVSLYIPLTAIFSYMAFQCTKLIIGLFLFLLSIEIYYCNIVGLNKTNRYILCLFCKNKMLIYFCWSYWFSADDIKKEKRK